MDFEEGQDRDALRIYPPHYRHRHEHGPEAPALAALEPCVAWRIRGFGMAVCVLSSSVPMASSEEMVQVWRLAERSLFENLIRSVRYLCLDLAGIFWKGLEYLESDMDSSRSV